MIVPFIPFIFIMIIVIAADHERCHRSDAALFHRCSTVTPKPAAPARVAKLTVPDATRLPRARPVVAQPSADDVTIRQVTAATAVAGRLTAVASAQGAANKQNPRVILVMTRPDVTSVSDLAGKDIAIDDRAFASTQTVRNAIASAGAADVKLNIGRTEAVTRLINKKVPAAVLAVVSPDASESYPEIAGFKIFRIPLPPR